MTRHIARPRLVSAVAFMLVAALATLATTTATADAKPKPRHPPAATTPAAPAAPEAAPSPAPAPPAAPTAPAAAPIEPVEIKAAAPPAGRARDKDERAPAPPPAVSAADVDKLRSEYEELRDALFRSRARAQAVEDAVSKTRLAATLRWKAPDDFLAARAQIRLDDAPLWESAGPLGEEPVSLPERGVAPGRHTLTMRLEIRGKKNDRLGYSSEQTFAVELPDGKTTEIRITADDHGDLPEYSPRISVEPRTKR